MEQYEIGLLASDSAEDLAEKAISLLNDRPRREYLGANARHVAENVFDWEHGAAALEEFYEGVLERYTKRESHKSGR